jgi:hypothetical protein
MGGLRYRSFSSETSALRINFFLGSNSKTTITQQADDTITTGLKMNELRDKKSMLTFNIRPGIEKHFTGTDRLSPYMGAELDFGMGFSTEKSETEAYYSVASAAGQTPEVYTKTTKGKDGYMTFGANLVTGFDWYFTKKLYMGAELGFGFSFKKDAKTKVTDEDAKAARDFAIAQTPAGAVAPPAYEDPNDLVGGSSMSFGPTVNGQIRLGFLF